MTWGGERAGKVGGLGQCGCKGLGVWVTGAGYEGWESGGGQIVVVLG